MGMSTAQVQAALAAAMTAQGYTDTRAANLDNLDAQISSRAVPGAEMNLTPVYDAAKNAASAQDVANAIEGIEIPNPDLSNLPTREEFKARTLPSGEYATASAVAALGAGNGSIEWSYTVTHGTTGAPISDVLVRVTTDAAGLYSIAQGRTNQYGVVTFQLDPGTVYLWLTKSGWAFTNPDTEVVA